MTDSQSKILWLMPDGVQAGNYWWSLGGDGQAVQHGAEPAGLDDIRQMFANIKLNAVLVLPDHMMILRTTEVERNQQKHLSQSLAWQFEEELPVRVEEWHFSHAMLSESSAMVVAVKQSTFSQHIDNLRSVGFDPIHALPACHLAAAKQGQIRAFYDGFWVGLSVSNTEHYLCNENTLSASLKMVSAEHGDVTMVVRANSKELVQAAQKIFKKSKTKIKIEYQDTPLLAECPQSLEQLPINLLQGGFTAKIRWGSLWSQWRAAAASIALLGCVYTAGSVADYYTLSAEQVRLQENLNTLQQDVYPDKAFDSGTAFRESAEDELSALSSQIDGLNQPSFARWLGHIGYGLKVGGDSELRLLNYNLKKGIMRIEFETKNYEEIESIRDVLKKRGVESDIKNSTAKSGVIRTRLECKLLEPS